MASPCERRPLLVLQLLVLLLVMLAGRCHAKGCSTDCVCFEGFVSCSQSSSFPPLPPSTKELVLSNCNLTSLPPGAFQALTSLKTVELVSCTLGTLPPGSFAGLRNLDYFTISQSTISQIQDGAFRNMSNITSLLLFQNTIGDIQANAFQDLRYMKDFTFRSNKINRIFPNAFSGISHVVDLQLTENYVGELQTGAFWDVKNVSTFVAFKNHVTTLQCGTFDVVVPASQTSNFNGNSFSCTCSLDWIFYSPLLEKFLDNDCVFPASPDSVVSLRTVGEADLGCPASATPMERGCSVLPEFTTVPGQTPASTNQAPTTVKSTTDKLTSPPPSPSLVPGSGSTATQEAVTSAQMSTSSTPEVGGSSNQGSSQVTGMSTSETLPKSSTMNGRSSSAPPPTSTPTTPTSSDSPPEATERQGSVTTSGLRGAAASRDQGGSVVGLTVVCLGLALLLLRE